MCVIVFLVLTVLAVVGGWYLAAFAGSWAAEAGWAAVAATTVLAPLLALFAHEAGHLVTGRAAGMRPVLMIAGPLGLFWPSGRVWPRLRLVPLIMGGFTLCVPGPHRSVRRQMLVMVTGGPGASLFLTVIGAAVALSADGAWQHAAAFTGCLSGAMLLTTALPYSRKGVASDGAKIRMLMKDTCRSRALAANLSLLAAARESMPPAQWPRGELEAVLAAGPDTPERAAGLHLAYWVALDEGNEGRAECLLAALQETAEGMSEAIATPVAFEAAAFYLFVHRRPETARVLIEGRRLPDFEDRHLEPLVRAGLALAAGERSRAAELADLARAQIRRALFPAVAALHARWLDEVEAELAEPAAPPPVAQGCATAP